MTTHTMTVKIVLPETCASVRELLGQMARHLEADAERYKKTHKVGPSHPAIVDKLDAAKSIKRLVRDLEKRNKTRWTEYNAKFKERKNEYPDGGDTQSDQAAPDSEGGVDAG